MRRVATVDAVEEIIGTTPQIVLLKTTDELDDGCRAVLSFAPIAALGFRDADGLSQTTLVGGRPGFAEAVSPTQLSFDLPSVSPWPQGGGAVSMEFLLPGVGETLRLNGAVEELSGRSATMALHEAWVHCARCVLRSGLWSDARRREAVPARQPVAAPDALTGASLARRDVKEFLAASPFAFVSSWDDTGCGDTSPKGDPPGFIRVLDANTLVIPDRRGNKRADTFHNLMTCDQLSLAVLVPGRNDVLHLTGRGLVTDDPTLLGTMALKDKPPHAALVVEVREAEIRPNEALQESQVWDPARHVDRAQAPDLMNVASHHLAKNKSKGATASMTRALSRGLAASPKLVRRVIDAGYRKELHDEGY